MAQSSSPISGVAERYAGSLFELALQANSVAKVEADLEKARTAGDAKRIASLEENLESRKQFLEMAKRASADFS